MLLQPFLCVGINFEGDEEEVEDVNDKDEEYNPRSAQ